MNTSFDQHHQLKGGQWPHLKEPQREYQQYIKGIRVVGHKMEPQGTPT